jgi:two-component system sensor histidine kinase ChvG
MALDIVSFKRDGVFRRPTRRAAPGGDRDQEALTAARAATKPLERARPRRAYIPLTARILAINVLALALLLGGFFYLDRYQRSLFENKIDSLKLEGTLIAAGLTSDTDADGPRGRRDLGNAASFIGRLELPADLRVRVFDTRGRLLVDSQKLPGARVQTSALPAPPRPGFFNRFAVAVYDWIVKELPPHSRMPRIVEGKGSRTVIGATVGRALTGETTSLIGETAYGSLAVLVALPVQAIKRVEGALLITASAEDIAVGVREMRFAVLESFGIALGITVLLSLYLAGTITRPVRQLAQAAGRVRDHRGEKPIIPDFTTRRDEIGGLSGALRDMTSALWQRLDAIERFAADVAHEIKNPLSSVRSAVETAIRIGDDAKRRQLLEIVIDDVKRLDRLLGEISAASRLDSELSRTALEPVDLSRLLSLHVSFDREMHGETPGIAPLRLDTEGSGPFVVMAIEDRLTQVVQNLISNARSFSPPGAAVTLRLVRDGPQVRFEVEDEGPGVAEAMRERIFERFYSSRPEGEKFGTHAGLGLSISRQIVEAFGGRIACLNGRRGRGARFVISFAAASAGS